MLILGAFLERDIGHRIPGIDREIDQGVFRLGRINLAVPKFGGGDGLMSMCSSRVRRSAGLALPRCNTQT